MKPCCGITELYCTDPAEQAVLLYLRLSYEIDPVATELQGNRRIDVWSSKLWFIQRAALSF